MQCPCHKMVEAQKAALRKALDEHRWYESEKAGKDVGKQFSQLNFIQNVMPGWGKDFREKFCKECNFTCAIH